MKNKEIKPFNEGYALIFDSKSNTFEDFAFKPYEDTEYTIIYEIPDNEGKFIPHEYKYNLRLEDMKRIYKWDMFGSKLKVFPKFIRWFKSKKIAFLFFEVDNPFPIERNEFASKLTYKMQTPFSLKCFFKQEKYKRMLASLPYISKKISRNKLIIIIILVIVIGIVMYYLSSTGFFTNIFGGGK